MSDATIEERLSVLEQEVARLRTQVSGGRPPAANRTSPDFLEKYTGMFANDPLFEEMVRHVEEERERDRQQAIREADAEDTPA